MAIEQRGPAFPVDKKAEHEKHRLRHEVLHRHLDELIADMIRHTDHLPSTTTVMQLMEWSHQQTIDPTEEARF